VDPEDTSPERAALFRRSFTLLVTSKQLAN